MVIFYKKWKKYNEIQLTKNKMDLNNQIMKNRPSSPEMESKAGLQSLPIIWYYHTSYSKKHSGIQLPKNKMDLSNRKMKNQPPFPAKQTRSTYFKKCLYEIFCDTSFGCCVYSRYFLCSLHVH